MDIIEPQAVWQAFSKISAIPRCSKHEEQIRSFFRNFAKTKDLACQEDDAGNIVIRKAATRKDAEPIAIQAHLDMVCVAGAESDHNFTKDPIRLETDGNWLWAQGTTLGADNGIGLAMIYALLDDETIAHGPLEAVLTVDEESALVGACAFDGKLLQSRRLLNLDSEEEQILYYGCAGGQVAKGRLAVLPERLTGVHAAFRLSLEGLRGGHSGTDIHTNRANAIQCLMRVLALWTEPVRFLSLHGGAMIHNVIPSHATVDLLIPSHLATVFSEYVRTCTDSIKQEYVRVEPDMHYNLEQVACPESALSYADTQRVLNLLTSFPSGVLAMSKDVDNLVESSSMLAGAFLDDAGLRVISSQRSLREDSLDYASRQVTSVLQLAAADYELCERYPSWTPQPDSPLLAKTKDLFQDLFHVEPELRVIHAGLECGALCSRIPGLDAVSFGPDIECAHSVSERVRIASVERIWKFLLRCLEVL